MVLAVVPVVKTTVARPLELVFVEPLANEPPLPILLQVTAMVLGVATSLPYWSAAWALTVTAAPAIGLYPLEVTSHWVTAPDTPVAVKVTGEPLSELLVAVIVLAPWAVPSVQEPTVAIPEELVVAVRPVPEPPPEATANVTLTPDTGLLLASVTSTAGSVARTVPTVALWVLPVRRCLP